jgi:hypothetical protein
VPFCCSSCRWWNDEVPPDHMSFWGGKKKHAPNYSFTKLRAQQWVITLFLQPTRMWCLLQASFEDDSVDKSTRSRHISWSHRTVGFQRLHSSKAFTGLQAVFRHYYHWSVDIMTFDIAFLRCLLTNSTAKEVTKNSPKHKSSKAKRCNCNVTKHCESIF